MTKYVLFATVSVECDVDTPEELENMKQALQDNPVGLSMNGGEIEVLETYND